MSFIKFIPILALALSVASAQINYFGVAYSPYVKGRNADGQYPYWNSYSVDDIKQMLNIASTYHNSISTYSMGVNIWCKDDTWDKCDSNALIPRAAAQINKERGSVILSVSQGVYQMEDPALQDKEVQNAFAAVQEANSLFPGTVWSIAFTNEYVTDPAKGQYVLDLINRNKDRAHSMGIKVGARVHVCGQIHGGELQDSLIKIAQASDFIMCNIYPGPGMSDVDAAVGTVKDQYYGARDGLQKANPNIEVLIGETGWPSEGKSFNNDPSNNSKEHLVSYWNKVKEWANEGQVKIQMFEAFDEPWKGDSEFPAEGKYGWWYRKSNDESVYIEKATGKSFQ